MRNVIGQAVVGDDLYGRGYELVRLWEMLEQGEHILMLAPRRVGKTSLMLELRRAPRGNWNVIYVDVERGDGPADFVAAVLSALAADHRYRSRFEAIPFSGAVKDVLARLQSVSVDIDVLRVELKGAIGSEWDHAADQLQARLASLPPAGANLLIIVDELPFLVSRMLRTAERKLDAERLLSRLRYWRQAPELRGKVHTLVGGSIGLEGVLQRASLSGLINDLAPFHLDSWDRPTAVEFLKGLGSGCDFRLDDGSIARILDLLRDPVPYHVQLFFSALRDACGSEPSRVSSEMIERCFEERLAGARGTAYLDHYAERLEIAFDEREHEMARDILGRACRREDGASLAEIEDLRGHSEQTYLSVLRDLEADGYVIHEGSRLTFRSNLLRKWWRKYHHGRGGGAMIRRRLYNPAQLTPDELKASFVAREDTLAEMLRLIGEQPPGRPCQHVMLIGPRGMGKTTLGLRFLHALGDAPDLAACWQPVAFYEESYEIGDLADFWLAALRHLTRATNDPRWADRADALARDEGDTERLAAYALSALMDFSRENGKRLILFVENLDAIFGQLRDEREIHALRATLIERPDILLLGSANAVFEAIRSHGEPFYEFFRLFILEGLGREDAHRILAALAGGEGRPEVPETMKRERGRLETIRRLTGGNPRLLALACRMLIESPLGSAFEDLESLIDEQTPYFKARIEELPVQARKVFHCLAEGWKPMLAKEVAGAAKLSSSHASAQLRQLVEKGYAREVHLPNAKRTRYEVGDRFYNIYYLLRFSRAGRDRLERLVAFLGWLNRHGKHNETEAACRRATEIEPVHDESWRVLAEAILWQDDDARLPEAEECARRAVELAPENPRALHMLSDVLACRGRWTEALDHLEHALRIGGDSFQEKQWPGLTESLIPAVAAGYGSRVKSMMEEAGLAEPMEPLWHATRAELGEELEPLPAEIMETVTDLRQEFSDWKR